LTFAGKSDFTWVSATSDARALASPSGGVPPATTWFGTTFSVDLRLDAVTAQRITLYAVDWDGGGRAMRIDVVDGDTGQVLDTENVRNFGGGVYLTWRGTGRVKIVITSTGSGNAVVSGLFIE
jgi:hypothetical protein